MTLKSRAVAFIAVLMYVVSASTAFGCSYLDGALFPSNYERVKEADAIALVDAVSLNTISPPGLLPVSAKLTLKTVENIKGTFAADTIEVPLPSSCDSYNFQSAVGHRILLLLKKGPGNWYLSGSPLGELNGQW